MNKVDENIHGNFIGIEHNFKFALYVNEIHYICIVIDCEEIIPPNSNGKITIAMLSRDILDTTKRVGCDVELMHGTVKLGIGKITSFRKAKITSDNTDEHIIQYEE